MIADVNGRFSTPYFFIISEAIINKNISTIPHSASDHKPIILEVDIKEEEYIEKKFVCNFHKNDKENKFEHFMKQYLASNAFPSDANVNNMYKFVCNALLVTSKNTIPKKYYINTHSIDRDGPTLTSKTRSRKKTGYFDKQRNKTRGRN